MKKSLLVFSLPVLFLFSGVQAEAVSPDPFAATMRSVTAPGAPKTFSKEELIAAGWDGKSRPVECSSEALDDLMESAPKLSPGRLVFTAAQNEQNEEIAAHLARCRAISNILAKENPAPKQNVRGNASTALWFFGFGGSPYSAGDVIRKSVTSVFSGFARDFDFRDDKTWEEALAASDAAFDKSQSIWSVNRQVFFSPSVIVPVGEFIDKQFVDKKGEIIMDDREGKGASFPAKNFTETMDKMGLKPVADYSCAMGNGHRPKNVTVFASPTSYSAVVAEKSFSLAGGESFTVVAIGPQFSLKSAMERPYMHLNCKQSTGTKP